MTCWPFSVGGAAVTVVRVPMLARGASVAGAAFAPSAAKGKAHAADDADDSE